MSKKNKIVRAAGIVGSATFLSRILGFLRDVVIAAIFGAGMSTDAFFVAFKIPNLFRRLVGEGSLTVSFVPVFTEFLSTHSKEDSRRLVGSAFAFFSIILGLLTLLGIILAPMLVKLMSPGFGRTMGKMGLTVDLTRFMFPYLFFIGLVALSMGVLNTLKHFAAPALSPILLNISMIGSALSLGVYLERPVFALAIGVIIGGILQLSFQIPFLKRYGVLPRFNHVLFPPPVRQVVTLMLPAIIGVSVHQLNVLITTRFASGLLQGSISYLYYADRLIELPLGVFGISLATAVLPSMSEQALSKDHRPLKETISFALRLIIFISIPAMIGLMILRIPIVSLLFQRGEFTYTDTLNTAQAILFYSTGIAAFGGVKILASAFYSLKDTMTPVKIAAVSVAANILFCLIFIGPLKHGGLALATALASMLNFSILFIALRKRLGQFLEKGFYQSVINALAASVAMGVPVYIISLFGDWVQGTLWTKVLILLFAVSTGVGVFIFSTYILKSQEISAIKEILGLKKV
ncbi:MAG: murein biosynthesis integral membrane protein MurJ, partial [Thermodesulfobacteriota bacterium]